MYNTRTYRVVYLHAHTLCTWSGMFQADEHESELESELKSEDDDTYPQNWMLHKATIIVWWSNRSVSTKQNSSNESTNALNTNYSRAKNVSGFKFELSTFDLQRSTQGLCQETRSTVNARSESDDLFWNELSPQQQQAVLSLCYTIELLDSVLLELWSKSKKNPRERLDFSPQYQSLVTYEHK